MRLYGRGIRRRLAPMLRGDRRRIELAYALQFSLPGTPAIRYGEEIGMGEDLALDGREAIRTPMQWDDGPTPASVPAPPTLSFAPSPCGVGSAPRRSTSARSNGPEFAAALVREPDTHPAYGAGDRDRYLLGHDAPLPRSVLAHRFDAAAGSILLTPACRRSPGCAR